MRVLVVSQYYPPENVPIPAAVARGLAERGHHVRVVTGYPNYPEGRLHEGYRARARTCEQIDGIDVLRVPLFIDHSQNATRRMLNYLSFGASSATARRLGRGADVVYVYATQMTAAFGPWLWRLLGGAPYVLHIQDLWPDSVVGSSMVRPGSRARVIEGTLNPWLQSVYRRAAAIIGIAPRMVEELVNRGTVVSLTAILAIIYGVPWPAALAPLAIYAVDTSAVIVGRIARRERVWEPHRLHSYQRLLDAGFSQGFVAAFVTVFTCLAAAAGALSLTDMSGATTVAIGAVAGLCLVYLGAADWLVRCRQEVML